MKLQLPFTADQFFEVFRDYNTAVWPAQILLYVLALVALVAAFVARKRLGQVIAGILAILWLWQGIAYHVAFFARINPLAYAFGALSVAAASIFLWHGVIRSQLQFRWSVSPSSLAGVGLIAFSLMGYPVVASLRHPYPELPTFGLPCPTTLFTIGLLGFLAPQYPRLPLVIPTAWCLVGLQAAFLFGVTADYSLLAAGHFGLVRIARARLSTSDPSH